MENNELKSESESVYINQGPPTVNEKTLSEEVGKIEIELEIVIDKIKEIDAILFTGNKDKLSKKESEGNESISEVISKIKSKTSLASKGLSKILEDL